ADAGFSRRNSRVHILFAVYRRDICSHAMVVIMPNFVEVQCCQQVTWVRDNRALARAVDSGLAIIPVYIWAPEEEGDWPYGGASRWWLHHSLSGLADVLSELGAPLVVRQGDSIDILRSLVEQTGASRLYYNRRYEPHARQRDELIEAAFANLRVTVESFNSTLLFEPWQVRTNEGNPYKVFTPFWKRCCASESGIGASARTFREVEFLMRFEFDIPSLDIGDLALLPEVDWTKGLDVMWSPGEHGSQVRLKQFVQSALGQYEEGRDRPYYEGVSFLSPHLHFGEIGPAQIWSRVQDEMGTMSFEQRKRAQIYLKELGWREFAYHVLYNFPETTSKPLRSRFEQFLLRSNHEQLRRWQLGQTGYPIVDAGMRQLWTTGWMHNRVRMIVASFLTKDLRLSFREGARWFFDTLVDADLPSNTMGCQWAA
ncbi:MAG: DNA photolyase family protein, partial [Candidatus Obscuribacterales bacterium]|nr:DNA photolyase family protein [Candidatus Obscuribacterales bacterium]